MSKFRVGILGCGAISANYLRNAANLPILEVTAVADLIPEAAQARAAEFGIGRACSVDQLLADPNVDAILNLTIPAAHASTSIRALEAGKHVYVEKPFGISRTEGMSILEAGRRAGKLVGCAPDTVLGAGIQTARALLDEGAIGRPVGFAAQMLSGGPERFHPNPAFFYQPGGGPLFDMGPYYLTALLLLLGPVRRYQATATVAIADRVVATGPREGEPVEVNTPDHICTLLEFESGVSGTLTTSFAIRQGDYDRQHPILVYGTEGTLRVPDPNLFDLSVELRRVGEEEWTEVPFRFQTGYGRSVGLADLALAVRDGRPPRCGGAEAMAVIDLMDGILSAAAAGRPGTPEVPYTRPQPMPSEGLFPER